MRRRQVPVPEAPQTIRQNWIPFLTFFFLRVLRIYGHVSGRAKLMEAAWRRWKASRARKGEVLRGRLYRRHCWRRTVRVVRLLEGRTAGRSDEWAGGRRTRRNWATGFGWGVVLRC
jgi:hypothetical protein